MAITIDFHVRVPKTPIAVFVCEAAAESDCVAGHRSNLPWGLVARCPGVGSPWGDQIVLTVPRYVSPHTEEVFAFGTIAEFSKI